MRPWPCRILQDLALWLTPVCIDPRLKAPDHEVHVLLRPLKHYSGNRCGTGVSRGTEREREEGKGGQRLPGLGWACPLQGDLGRK
eukprot:9325224-Pyramimonas_sp.AAC.1